MTFLKIRKNEYFERKKNTNKNPPELLCGSCMAPLGLL
jgi:hypothetical protein